MHPRWLLLLALTACADDGGGEAVVAPDAAPGPDAATLDLGEPDRPPVDAEVPTDQGTAAMPCTLDEQCPTDRWCHEGACAAPAALGFAWPQDGVARAAAAPFEITPEYLEPWTDRAGPACPDNRPGRFDAPLDAPPADEPCVDRYEDANGNGIFDAVWLGGAGTDRPAAGVDNDNPPAGRVLLLTRDDLLQVVVVIDVHALEPALGHALAGRLAARLGLAPERITLVATGTRTGPDAVGLSGPSLDRLAAGRSLRARLGGALGLVGGLPVRSGVAPRFVDDVADRTAAAVRRAGERLAPVRVRAGRAALPVAYEATAGEVVLPDADADGVLNSAGDRHAWRSRRLPLARDTHLPGLVDPDLSVLALEDAVTGAPLVVLGIWGAAPAARPGAPVLSADFPGRFRRATERFLPGAVAIWLPGAAGETVVAGGDDVWVPEVDSDGNLLSIDGLPVDTLDDAAPAGEPATALGRLLAAQARAVVAAVESEPFAFEVTSRYAWVPLHNPRYGLAARLGLLPRLGDWLTGRAVSDAWASAMHAPACGGLGCLRHRLDRLDLGPVTLVFTPGALDLGYALGRQQSTLAFEDERNLLDLDADGLPDAQDPELRLQVSGGGRETVVVAHGPANPQVFPTVVALELARVWLVGRGPAVGSLLPRATAQNVFEGELAPLLEGTRMDAVAEVDVCATWGCRGRITLGDLAQQAWGAQPEVLADVPGAHELWLLDEPPAEPVARWRVETPDGTVLAAGEQAELGPGRRAYLPDHNLPALGVDRGHLLIATTPDEVTLRLPIGGIVPIELRQHPNPADAWSAASPGAGDLVYNAACDLLYGGACPYRLDYGADDPSPGLPTRP